MKKILLTGGGTAGHVTPNIALLPDLKAEGYDIHYIGSYEGMEKKLITAQGIHYDGIATGKFRRYLSAKNLTDPFRVIKGFQQAKKLIRDYKPDVVFSKGGFVAVPVVLAAGHYHIPVIIHESDMTPGLANKICMRTAKKICCNFPETVKLLPADKAVLTGTPIRRELLNGSRDAGFAFTGLSDDKPILLMMGGSTGSRAVNAGLRSALPQLLKEFHVIHLFSEDTASYTGSKASDGSDTCADSSGRSAARGTQPSADNTVEHCAGHVHLELFVILSLCELQSLTIGVQTVSPIGLPLRTKIRELRRIDDNVLIGFDMTQ